MTGYLHTIFACVAAWGFEHRDHGLIDDFCTIGYVSVVNGICNDSVA